MASFSRRNQYAGAAKEISIREDAPEGLRVTVLEAGRNLGCGPSHLRTIVCAALRVRPDPDNWSEYPNVWVEVQYLMYGCEWFKVYDIIEALHAHLVETGDPTSFAAEINAYFVEEGIGWQLVDGQIVTRGTEAFESIRLFFLGLFFSGKSVRYGGVRIHRASRGRGSGRYRAAHGGRSPA